MANDRKPDNRVWWIVGIVAVLLVLLFLCAAGVLAAGAVAYFTNQPHRAFSIQVPAPGPVVTVPVQPVPTPEFVPDYQLQRGALILSIEPGSPADAVEWQAGDIIVAVDGRDLDGTMGLREALSGRKPGDLVTFEWWSRQTRETQSVRVQLGTDPKGSGSIYLGIEYRMLP